MLVLLLNFDFHWGRGGGNDDVLLLLILSFPTFEVSPEILQIICRYLYLVWIPWVFYGVNAWDRILQFICATELIFLFFIPRWKIPLPKEVVRSTLLTNEFNLISTILFQTERYVIWTNDILYWLIFTWDRLALQLVVFVDLYIGIRMIHIWWRLLFSILLTFTSRLN